MPKKNLQRKATKLKNQPTKQKDDQQDYQKEIPANKNELAAEK